MTEKGLTVRFAVRCQICGNRLVEVDRACTREPVGHPHVRCASLSCARVMPPQWAACLRIAAVDVDGIERKVERIIVETDAS